MAPSESQLSATIASWDVRSSQSTNSAVGVIVALKEGRLAVEDEGDEVAEPEAEVEDAEAEEEGGAPKLPLDAAPPRSVDEAEAAGEYASKASASREPKFVISIGKPPLGCTCRTCSRCPQALTSVGSGKAVMTPLRGEKMGAEEEEDEEEEGLLLVGRVGGLAEETVLVPLPLPTPLLVLPDSFDSE